MNATRAALFGLLLVATSATAGDRTAAIRSATGCPSCEVNAGVQDPIAGAWKHSAGSEPKGDGWGMAWTAWVSTSGEILLRLDAQFQRSRAGDKVGKVMKGKSPFESRSGEPWSNTGNSDPRWKASPQLQQRRAIALCAADPRYVRPSFAAAAVTSHLADRGVREVEILDVKVATAASRSWDPDGLCVTWAGRLPGMCADGTVCIDPHGRMEDTEGSRRVYQSSVFPDCTALTLQFPP